MYTKVALGLPKPILVIGTIPEYGAWTRFLANNPQIKLAEDKRRYHVLSTPEGVIHVSKTVASTVSEAVGLVRNRGYTVTVAG